MSVSIIDYGMSNLTSVANAFESLGYSTHIATEPRDLNRAERIVLPGVGSFADGMKMLHEGGWLKVLEDEVRVKGKPFLGLCLGMQLLATLGEEHGETPGLGWVKGSVQKIVSTDPSLLVPHVGWNDVKITRESRLFEDVGESSTFYFVHSYCFVPLEEDVVTGTCDYHTSFVASIEAGNLFGTQFHPEKSQRTGLKVLDNFANLSS